jgi:hypothetical protein
VFVVDSLFGNFWYCRSSTAAALITDGENVLRNCNVHNINGATESWDPRDSTKFLDFPSHFSAEAARMSAL